MPQKTQLFLSDAAIHLYIICFHCYLLFFYFHRDIYFNFLLLLIFLVLFLTSLYVFLYYCAKGTTVFMNASRGVHFKT